MDASPDTTTPDQAEVDRRLSAIEDLIVEHSRVGDTVVVRHLFREWNALSSSEDS
jgi:hypothetical protein